MKSNLFARYLAVFLLVAGLVLSSSAQSGRKPPPTTGPKYRTQLPKDAEKTPDNKQGGTSDRPLADTTPVTVDDNGTIKMDTSLVTIPVSVIDRDGKFVPYLSKRDFRLYEDSVEQEIESFDSIETPFHVALLLDTSNSTMFKLEDIQGAAIAFANQLRRDDQVMVVSFDSRVRVQCEFTSDRDELRDAIYRTRTGGSTKLYEAVDLAVDRLEQIQGRKAIVLFTDGVDTSSRRANYQNTIEKVEESGALVYPIKYDTELDYGRRGGGPGNPRGTPPIITNPWPLPSPSPPGRRRWPFINYQFPQWPQGRAPSGGGTGSGDYRRGARYLQELADRSGGRLYNADTLYNLAQAFSSIAEELRHQYALSYYPTNAKKDGTYRRVKVRVEKPELIVRAREGYRAAVETQANGSDDRPALKRKQLATQ
jgi:VWFA-related protein